MTTLFPYQQIGARFLAEKKRALLADEPGLGKSAQAISACDRLAVGYGNLNVLVVCPASVRENWKREFAKFSVRRHNILVDSYDKVARDAPKGIYGNIDVLILDEAHYLKTRTAKRTKAIFGEKCDGVDGLVERARHVFLLTGTPTPNNPAELWPMLRAVMPRTIYKNDLGKPLAYWPFINRYCKLRDKGFGTEIVGGKNLAELRERIAPFVLRRKKSEVLKDLPPIRFDTLALEGRVETTPETEDAMIAVAEALAEGGVEGLAKIAPHVATLRRLTGLAKVAPAVEWIKDWFDGGGRRLVVFAHHQEVIWQLRGHEAFANLLVCWIDGGTPSDRRQLMVDAFQCAATGPALFIGQIQAAGTGITLHAASDVLFVESSWVPADNEQAAMRVHRIGQANACLVRYAMLAGSIDENIQRALVRKSSDTAALWG